MRPWDSRLVERERHRRRAGVAVLLDVGEHLVHRHLEALGDAADDAQVGLVRHHQIDVVGGHAHLRQHLFAGLRHATDGVAEDLAAVHDDVVVLAALEALGGRPALRMPPTSSLRMSIWLPSVPQAAASSCGLGRVGGDHRGGRRVAEQHAGVAVAPVHDLGQHLDADHQDALGAPSRTRDARQVERLDEAGAAAAAQRVGRHLARADARAARSRRCRGR